ncbi:MAG: chorismate mutase [Burkholderiaceae bacterium]|nr:MAG: chorismate mutase [Burkholderiaceae bacterium]
MTRAIDNVQHCTTMDDVRRHVDALDDILVPLLVQRGGYMTQAARIKQDDSQVRDEARIQAIVDRVRPRAVAEGGQPDVIEAIYRSMMEAYIAYEHREFARLRAAAPSTAQEG